MATYTKDETAHAAAIAKLRADADRLHRLLTDVDQARRDVDAALALAVEDCGVGVTRAAEEAGLSRESVYQAVRRHREWTQAAGAAAAG
jgi:DNA-binding phage protein